MPNVNSRSGQNIGTITTSGSRLTTSSVTFGLPGTTQTYLGLLTLTTTGGTASGAGWSLACSIDGGNTWFTILGVDPSVSPVDGGSGASGGTSVSYVSQYNVAGLGGALFNFGLTAGTVTGTINVWAFVG